MLLLVYFAVAKLEKRVQRQCRINSQNNNLLTIILLHQKNENGKK